MRKLLLRCIGAFVGMLVLILDSRTAMDGAQEAIALCVQSVIPSLFPFLILAGILTPSLISLNTPLLRPLGRLVGIPSGAEGILLTGLLGGYPVGAQMVTKAWEDRHLSREDAGRMLSFCNNCGPAFLFGILGVKFPEMWMVWVIWGIHILSAILVGILLPGKSKKSCRPAAEQSFSITQAMKAAVKTMGFICGWVILFRIILAFLDRWVLWLLPTDLRVFVYGLLELTNGCCCLETVSNTGLRFILCSVLLSFGGVCVLMQTASVTGKLGLGRYWTGKILQTLISCICSYFLQYFLFLPNEKVTIPPIASLMITIVLVVFGFMGQKVKNWGRNPIKIGV